MTRVQRCRGERGSATIEAVIVVPAFMLFVALIVCAGRYAVARQVVESAAAESARSASIARTHGDATREARTAAARSLHDQQLRCASQQVRVDTSGFEVPAGTPASVTATISCVVDIGDLTLPGVPGTRVITASVTSPIDTYRER
jgi:Flp pilus assembly protein TadG